MPAWRLPDVLVAELGCPLGAVQLWPHVEPKVMGKSIAHLGADRWTGDVPRPTGNDAVSDDA